MLRLAIIGLLLGALPAQASLAVCDRLTHISHGGVSDHVDLGKGKVMWTEWWAQEGAFKDVWLADCRSGIALEVRAHEERITDRYLFDRSAEIRALISHQAEVAPAFFTIDRVARLIRDIRSEITIAREDSEYCACAAAYPELRGGKSPYEALQ